VANEHPNPHPSSNTVLYWTYRTRHPVSSPSSRVNYFSSGMLVCLSEPLQHSLNLSPNTDKHIRERDSVIGPCG
jgi:hypothetical protein